MRRRLRRAWRHTVFGERPDGLISARAAAITIHLQAHDGHFPPPAYRRRLPWHRALWLRTQLFILVRLPQ